MPHNMIRTKIVCTIGPSCDSDDMLRTLIVSGMNVARLNFSHGTHAEHKLRVDTIRRVCAETKHSVAILLDDKGPEIRTGNFPEGKVFLESGQLYTFTMDPVDGSSARCSVSYSELAGEVTAGDSILIDDGLVEMEVKSVSSKEILCEVKNSGEISSNKGVNIPGVRLSMPSMTEKDKSDFLFAIENDLDYIAVSFVRTAEDMRKIRRFVDLHGGREIKLIAKIESCEAVDNIEEIIAVSDAVMVARGDLGVEIPIERVPQIQKQVIRLCNKAGIPVITATQMLDSMIRNPRPTRAEVSDVANAIYDGTSAVMLSGETASGNHPLESLLTMIRIVCDAENSIDYKKRFREHDLDIDVSKSTTGAICHATCSAAIDLGAAAIVAVTSRGLTARTVSAFHPDCPIIAPTPEDRTFRQLHLCWGVIPAKVSEFTSTDDLFNTSEKCVIEAGAASPGDLIVITAGLPLRVSGSTNMLKVQAIKKGMSS